VVASPAPDRYECFPEPCNARRLKHAKAIRAAAIPITRPPIEPPIAAPIVVCLSDATAEILAAEAMSAGSVFVDVTIEDVPFVGSRYIHNHTLGDLNSGICSHDGLRDV
jgi:hypothetical protein